MNILMYSTYFPPHYSGAAKQGVALAKELRKKGHKVEFVTMRRNVDEPFSDEYEGFKVWRLEQGRGVKHREIRFWWNFLCFLARRRGDFDILHSHGATYPSSIVGPLGWIFRKPSLVKCSMANNDLAGLGQGVSGKLHRFFLRRVDVCVAISKELVDEFKGYGFAEDKILFLPNGVDTARFIPLSGAEKSKIRQGLELPEQQPVALSVGVFDARKNIGWLIDQWIAHNGFGTGALLLAVGPQSREDAGGRFLDGLKSKADAHPDLVRIVSHVENIENYFQASDFFILPSTNEGMPNVVLEAMSTGLPCVTTPVSGCGDLIEEGRTGFFFQPNDPEGLSLALTRMMASDLQQVGACARTQIETGFSLTYLAGRYDQIYAECP
ncbi:glycosyltransferase family 4 protein [Geoalkalibacter halelectricus]|uniref:glycosyltransferase family 4 protein n=1 Tax=Geoalkalibacter halelectricus TaxID=2847045 RepID=UPI003D220FC0